jgi:hypothetical protein
LEKYFLTIPISTLLKVVFVLAMGGKLKKVDICSSGDRVSIWLKELQPSFEHIKKSA